MKNVMQQLKFIFIYDLTAAVIRACVCVCDVFNCLS